MWPFIVPLPQSRVLAGTVRRLVHRFVAGEYRAHGVGLDSSPR